ncbi:MAG: YceI family protein [Thermoleophilia bacterium]|jgi:polyisoprenoid-binding protein YceI|nr:YceI family protein [Thermoleophilia bacterium]
MSTATLSTLAPSTTWNADPVHSTVAFRVRHFGLTWLRGGFQEFTLAASVDDQGALKLEGTSPVDSISFPNEQLKGHLMAPDFFDAQMHPTLSFTSTSVDLADDGTATVIADLTLRGTTKPVTLTGRWAAPTEGLAGDTRFGLELAGEINRHDFGISWAAQLGNGADVVAPTVKIEGEFELVQA